MGSSSMGRERPAASATKRRRVATTRPDSETVKNHAAFIWSVADLLRGNYKPSEYGRVVLPLTVIRRLGRDSRHRPERGPRAGSVGGVGASGLTPPRFFFLDCRP